MSVVSALALVAAGCTSGLPIQAPVDGEEFAGADSRVVQPVTGADGVRTRIHRVKRGDTLYAIAWRYGLDYKELARWNGIGAPYTIYPDQPLLLSDTGIDWPQHRSQGGALAKSGQRSPPRSPAANAAKRAKPVAPRSRGNAPMSQWMWPTKGRIVKTFKGTKRTGIDIAGKRGQDVLAAADGRVVYSGSGLRGYGQLIIVKHNKRFLSAYAHNKKLHVTEGDEVVRGQRIAEMGDTDSDRVKLHFEIRRDGKPVDPISYLPLKPG